MRWYGLLIAVSVGAASLAVMVPGAAQQQFPASATIRGENIWLRAEPSEETEIVAYLQRGDPVTITGPEQTADGETFVPIEAVATGDSGWVRELAINPRTIVAGGGQAPTDDDTEQERPRRPRPTEEPVVIDLAPPAETPVPVEPAPVPIGDCDPSYPDLCIPPGSEDLDCDYVYAQGLSDITVLPPDPHGFDGNDNDGVGCEGG